MQTGNDLKKTDNFQRNMAPSNILKDTEIAIFIVGLWNIFNSLIPHARGDLPNQLLRRRGQANVFIQFIQ